MAAATLESVLTVMIVEDVQLQSDGKIGDRPLALVTGASSGIGKAFVELLAREGFDLIAVARSGDAMKAHGAELAGAAGVRIDTLALDLTSAHAPGLVEEAVRQDGRPLSLLVNNAGFGILGSFADKDLADQVGMIDLNNRVMVELSHRFLPDLIKTGGGLINVASLSAWMPMPYLSVYSATKAFARVFTRMLAVELAGKGVRVTVVCPGYTTTRFHARAGVDKIKVPRIVPVQTSEAVAAEGYRGWRRGKTVVVTGRANKIAALTTRFIQPVLNLVGRQADRRINHPD